MTPGRSRWAVPLAFAAIAAAFAAPTWGRFTSAASGASAARASAQEESSGQRDRAQPQPWKRGPIRSFRTVIDRAEKREASLQGRADRRAYDGAPPVMPHSSIFGDGTKTCVDCHTLGMKLGERVAHPMSHPPFSNCLQCHVESTHRQFPPQSDVQSTFAGMPSPGPGTRQGPEAPPQIPHSVSMRGQCLSCHGEFGYLGLRTTHPERSNCAQCHVEAWRGR